MKLWSSQCAFNLSSLKSNLEIKFRLERDSNPWPCDTGAMFYPLSYQATWINGQLWVRNILDHSKYIWIWKYKKHTYENHIYPYMIFKYSYSYIFTIIGYITNSELTIFQAWIFSGCFFNRLSWKHTAMITISLIFRTLITIFVYFWVANCGDPIVFVI